MSLLSTLFPNPTRTMFIMGMGAIIACIVLAYQLDKTEQQLFEATQTIKQLQQAQKLAESANTKLSEHKEAVRNETARQNQIANEALANSEDWAGAYLPESVLRLFRTETTTTNTVPPSNGATR